MADPKPDEERPRHRETQMRSVTREELKSLVGDMTGVNIDRSEQVDESKKDALFTRKRRLAEEAGVRWWQRMQWVLYGLLGTAILTLAIPWIPAFFVNHAPTILPVGPPK